MSLIRKITKAVLLAPVEVVRGVEDAINNVTDPPPKKPKPK